MTNSKAKVEPGKSSAMTPGQRSRAARELRKEMQEQKTLERAASRKAKAVVFEFEKRNRSKIAIFKSTGTWWKMGGRSALFYHYVISKRLKIKTNLRPDTDVFDNFPQGIISVKSDDWLREKFKTIDIHECQKGENWVVFDTGTSFTDEEITRFEGINKAKQKQLNSIVGLEVVEPELFNCLLTVAKTTFDNVRKLDASKRELTGNNLYCMTEKMLLTYFELAKGSIPKADGKQTLLTLREDVLNRLKLMQEYRLFDLDVCIKIGKGLVSLKDILDRIPCE